jgi:hypothetical protein
MSTASCTRRPIVCAPSTRRRAAARGRPRWIGAVVQQAIDPDAGGEQWHLSHPDDAPGPL